MPAPVCKGQVSYKKTPGVLEFGNGALKFTPKGASAPTVRVPNSDVSSESDDKAREGLELTACSDIVLERELAASETKGGALLRRGWTQLHLHPAS